MAKFIYKGNNVGFTNSTEKEINFGDVVPLKNCIAVAADSISPLMTGTVTLSGVFEINAKADDVFEVGQTVYWSKTDNAVTATNTDDIVAGIAVEPKASGEAEARIKIGATAITPKAGA